MTEVDVATEVEDEGVMTVVETATAELEMMVLLAGQFVTSGPQLVTVIS